MCFVPFVVKYSDSDFFFCALYGEFLRFRIFDCGGAALGPWWFILPIECIAFMSMSHSERQTLDHHRHKSFIGHHFADVDKIQLRQNHLVDTGHIPFR